jgi:hypothetical protein
MAETFLTRIPTLDDDELLAYLRGRAQYKPEAVEVAARELERRGVAVPPGLLEPVRPVLPRRLGLLARARGPWRSRLRLASGAVFAAGFAAGLVITRRALAVGTSPLEQEPFTKSYQRQMEMVGGKANLVASDLRTGITGLFTGQNLAWTVFVLGCLAALVLWGLTLGRASGD